MQARLTCDDDLVSIVVVIGIGEHGGSRGNCRSGVSGWINRLLAGLGFDDLLNDCDLLDVDEAQVAEEVLLDGPLVRDVDGLGYDQVVNRTIVALGSALDLLNDSGVVSGLILRLRLVH